MELGIALPHFGPYASPPAIVRIAQQAEQMGFSAVWMLERMLRPTHPIPQPGGQMAPASPAYATAYSVLETLAFVAAKTERIRLGTSVIDALFQPPAVLGKRLATLDQLSGGRVLAGLGQGSIVDEFTAAGVPYKRRGRGLEEYVSALRAVWGPDPVEFQGRFYTIPASEIGPKPVQPGGPPILIGAMAPNAIERAARIADGFNPGGSSLDQLRHVVGLFRQNAQAAGRDLAKLQIVVRANGYAMGGNRALLTGAPDEIAADLAGMAEMGVTHAFYDPNFTGKTIDEQLHWMDAAIQGLKRVNG